MKRIYHRYEKWEDHKAGLYDNCKKENKTKTKKLVIEMFEDYGLTMCFMNNAINEWVYSCEHNLTNDSLNRIAYIGQAACCLYAKSPNLLTMNVWYSLSQSVRDRSDFLARRSIKKWELNQRLKSMLKSGKIKDTKKVYQMKLHLN